MEEVGEVRRNEEEWGEMEEVRRDGRIEEKLKVEII